MFPLRESDKAHKDNEIFSTVEQLSYEQGSQLLPRRQPGQEDREDGLT